MLQTGGLGWGARLEFPQLNLIPCMMSVFQLAVQLMNLNRSASIHQAPIPCIPNGGNMPPEHGNWLLGGEKNLTVFMFEA